MKSKSAFLFPGQGSQYVGMGKDFFSSFLSARRTFEEADETLKTHLSRLIFEGPSADLALTKNSQMAIYVVSIAIYRVLQERFPFLQPSVCTGLSLGEYCALTAARRLSFEEGVLLVEARGRYMHEASLRYPGSMTACLGLSLDSIEEVIAALPRAHPVWIANLNCPGQVVLSGTVQGLHLAGEQLKAKGAKRLIPLEVSGAFHSGLMKEAQERLRERLGHVSLHESDIPVVLNVRGDYVLSTEEIRKCLIDQVVSPVLWEQGVRRIVAEGVELLVEVGCGKSLSGMNRKMQLQGTLTVSVEKVEDLEEMAKALDRSVVTGGKIHETT